jgi:hypothetical protein
MSNNQVIKSNDVNLSLMTVVKVAKNNQPTNYLLNYNGGQFIIQGCWLKMCSGGGLAPGETLSNGVENQFYTTQEARDYLKIPLNEVDGCCVQNDGTSNSEEIKQLIKTLQNIDTFIKNSKEIHKIIGIDEDDIGKYNSIFKKDKQAKKDKTKTTSMISGILKVKLLINFENKKDITTALFDVDRDTNVTTPYEPINDIFKLETIIKYNCEILPIIKLVKIWKQPKGDWGVTLKLLKARIKKPLSKNSNTEADFIDDANSTQPTKQTSTKLNVSNPTITNVDSSESDSESDDKDSTPQLTKVSSNPVKSKSTTSKQSIIAEVESSDSESDDNTSTPTKPVVKAVLTKPVNTKQSKIAEVESSDSESESDDNASKVTKSVAKSKSPVTKPVIVDSSESESEEIKPVKKAVKGKGKK